MNEKSISLVDVYTAAEIYSRIGSKSTVLTLEREKEFPKRHYFDSDSPHPRRPFWIRAEVDTWLAARILQSEEARAKAGQLGARLIRAKQLRAAA